MNHAGGEVFTGPVEDSMEGHVYFFISGDYGGREGNRCPADVWRKVRWSKASAEKNQDYLVENNSNDEGSKRVGSLPSEKNEGIKEFTRESLSMKNRR